MVTGRLKRARDSFLELGARWQKERERRLGGGNW